MPLAERLEKQKSRLQFLTTRRLRLAADAVPIGWPPSKCKDRDRPGEADFGAAAGYVLGGAMGVALGALADALAPKIEISAGAVVSEGAVGSKPFEYLALARSDLLTRGVG